MSVIDEIKSQIDPVDIIGETVSLRKTGKNYTGFCPFHPNSRTPAFVVFPDTGTWRCFGQCNEGGDVFQFVMKKEGWEFGEALRYLADRTGVQLKPQTPAQIQAAEEYDNLRTLLEEAVTFYRHNLLNTPAGKVALRYLREQRQLTGETMEAFGIGYAPRSWEATLQYFVDKGYKIDDLTAAGMVSERDDGGVYDRFRHRVMIPIRDYRGRMSGFGARILDLDDVPKFLNSPQTVLFDKSRTLYGMDRARRAIREKEQAVIVEGYLDVIALHQAGFENVVSPMGTALTENHLRQLKRYSRNIVLALDPDAAGDQATLRGLEVARQAMDRQEEPVFDPRGLMGQEARLQADIRVATLPGDQDPDEVVHADPAEWERIIKDAQPVVIHVMQTLAAAVDLDDPKAKSEIAARVLPLIEDVPGAIERDAYRQRLARLLRVDERSLLDSRAAVRRQGQRQSVVRRRRTHLDPGSLPSKPLKAAPDSVNALEAHCLGILLRAPDLLYSVDRALQEQNLPRVTVEDFQDAGHQTIFRLLGESLVQDMVEPLNYILNALTLDLMVVADGLLERTGEFDSGLDKVLDDLLRTVLDLRKRGLHQSIDYLRFLMEDAQEKGDMKASAYLKAMVQHSEALNRLNAASGKFTGNQRMFEAKNKK